MSLDKLPEDFLDQGYIKAHHSPASQRYGTEDNVVSLYTHLTDTSIEGDRFEIVGNYFTLNAKNVPLTKAQDEDNYYGYNADPFAVGYSKVRIFNFANKQELNQGEHWFVSQDKENPDNLIEVQPDGQRQAISNLDMRGNAPRAAEDNSGGLWAFGQIYNFVDFEVDNTIAKDFVATAEFGAYTTKRVLSNSIFGNNYSFGIIGSLPGDTNYIVGSELEKFGGPVFAITAVDWRVNPFYDMVDGKPVLIDQSETVHPRRAMFNVDYDTLIDNSVTGYEKWFESYGNIADQVKAMLLQPMQDSIQQTIEDSGTPIQKIPKMLGSIDTDQGKVSSFQFVEMSFVSGDMPVYDWDNKPAKNGMRFVDFSGKTQGTQEGTHGDVKDNRLTTDDLVNDFDMGSYSMWQDRGTGVGTGTDNWAPVGNALQYVDSSQTPGGFGKPDLGGARLPVVQGMGTDRDAYGLFLPMDVSSMKQDFYGTKISNPLNLLSGSFKMSSEANKHIIPHLFGDNNKYVSLFAYDVGQLGVGRNERAIGGSMQLVLKYYR